MNDKKNTSFEIEISDEKGVDINPKMIGLFFEDINYAADGGLYAEMIENRSFEAMITTDRSGGCEAHPEFAWTVSSGSAEYKTASPLNENNTHYAEISGGTDGAVIINKAYEGIVLEKGKKYKCSVWAKKNSYDGEIKFSVIKNDIVYLSGVLSKEAETERNDGWCRYSAELSAENSVRYAMAAVIMPTLKENETVCLDMVSLMPSDAVLGIFRRDLAEKLKALKPGFLRFPGGCIIEGYNLENRYKWKNSVGAVEERKQDRSRWGIVKEGIGFEDYNQTFGIGFYEYFMLCEYLDCKAIPVLSVGLSCQYNTKEAVSIYCEDNKTYTKEFREYIDDALDLIEFANGGTDTCFGALRAKMGHKEPFNLELLGIGNEQWEENHPITGKDNQWFERYEIFEREIHKIYPEIKLISSAGPDVKSPKYGEAWRWLHIRTNENQSFTYAVDEHYYNAPNWFFENDTFYDRYSRKVKVFAGEYASRDSEHSNDLWTALSEAAFMTGLERNADIICMASYAPLLARINYNQWSPDMIWFDDKDSYATPDYYVQKMYSENMGDITLKSKAKSNLCGEKCYHTAAYDKKSGDIIIKLINKYDKAKAVMLNISETFSLDSKAKIGILSGNSACDKNSIDEPFNICDREFEIENISNSYIYTMPKLSFSVIRIHTK